MPAISIVLPVKNGEAFLSEAIESVLNQTFVDYELIIFDDNSTDNTLDIIKSYRDKRISYYRGNEGFIANLNTGIKISLGRYLARMDADDVMNPSRLQTQFDIMETQKIDICSSWITIFGENFTPYIQHKLGGFIKDPVAKLLSGNFVIHPTVMMRKAFLIDHSLQYPNSQYTEDYKLWFEAAKRNAIFYVEPKSLLHYRISAGQVTRVHKEATIQNSIKIQKEIIEYLLHTSPNKEIDEVKNLYVELLKFESKGYISFKNISNVLAEIFSDVYL